MELDQAAEQLRLVTATIGQAVDQQRRLTGDIVALAGATGENTQEVSIRITKVNNAAAGVLQLSDETRQCAEEIALHLGELLAGGVHDLETMRSREETAEAAGQRGSTNGGSPQHQETGNAGEQ